MADKKLRIIAFTHEEIAYGFVRDTLDLKGNFLRGQILKITPSTKTERESKTKVILYPKEKRSKSGSKTL